MVDGYFAPLPDGDLPLDRGVSRDERHAGSQAGDVLTWPAIGFIGLGNMGLPMLRNLLAAGHTAERVRRGRERLEMPRPRRAPGRRRSAVEAASSAEVVITMLPEGRHVREVYLGADGVIARGGRRCAADRLLDHRRRHGARGLAGGGGARPGDGRRAGFGRRRRGCERDAHLHGRRRGGRGRPGAADPRAARRKPSSTPGRPAAARRPRSATT